MKNPFKNFKLTKNGKRLLVFSLFGAITLGCASSTLLFMGGNDSESNSNGNVDDENNSSGTIDEVKNKLFENLTAADMDIQNLKVSVGGLLNSTNTLDIVFNGGANYLSFMKDQTGNGDVNLEDVTAKFGGVIDIDMKDTSLKDNVMLDEKIKVYAPGSGTIYLDWNDTGYTISGNFISSTLKAVTLFLSSEQNQKLNGLLEQIQQIDILSLLPMVGTIGGSLASDKEVLENGNFRYKIEIPGSLISNTFQDTITINLDCNSKGELTNLSLNLLAIPIGGKTITLSMGTDNIKMHGINSGTSNEIIDDYKNGLTGSSLEEYYTNNLDSTPNIITTIGKMMKSKSFQFDYSLDFNEFALNDAAPAYIPSLGDKNEAVSHTFNGKIQGDFKDGFNNGNYGFSINKSAHFGNNLSVQYQGGLNENNAKGILIGLNGTKGYMSDASLNDLFGIATNITKENTIERAFATSNDILNNSVIADIIAGNYYKYKEILKKITIKNDIENSVTLSIQVLLGGLNLNIPFQFESTPVEININYKNTNNMENNLINYVELKNVPIRRVTRNESNVAKTYLDVATLKLNLSSVDNSGLTLVTKNDLSSYVDYKAAIPLFNSISDVIKKKQFNSAYTLTYNHASTDYVFKGTMAADLNEATFNSTAALTDKNYGKYRLTAAANINDIAHNVQLDYIPNPSNNDQTLYFNYYSQNPDYRTRLSLNTQTMSNMFDVISTIIAQNNNQQVTQSTVNQLNKDIFGSISQTLDSLTDFVNGNIWNILKMELPADKVNISNLGDSKDKIKVSIDLSLFNSTLNSGKLDLILGQQDKYSAINVAVNIPNSKDKINFAFNFDDFNKASLGLSADQISKYKESDSTVNAVMNILTGNFLDSFNLGGFVSTKRQSPRYQNR